MSKLGMTTVETLLKDFSSVDPTDAKARLRCVAPLPHLRRDWVTAVTSAAPGLRGFAF
jgi:hypothetical protein